MTNILTKFRGLGRKSAKGGKHAIANLTYTGKSIVGESKRRRKKTL